MSCFSVDNYEYNILHSVTDTLEFPDFDSFLQWKEKEEAETFTCYTKPKGSVAMQQK